MSDQYGFRYHSPFQKGYPKEIADMDDYRLRAQLEHYGRSFARDVAANKGNDGIRVRGWRRYVIQEALRRGLISEDPGGAP